MMFDPNQNLRGAAGGGNLVAGTVDDAEFDVVGAEQLRE